MAIIPGDPFGPSFVPFLRTPTPISSSLSPSFSVSLSFDFFSFLLISIRRAGLATARLIRSLAYWSSHSHEDTMLAIEGKRRWFYSYVCTRVHLFSFFSLFALRSRHTLHVYTPTRVYPLSFLSRARARARLHHSEDIPKNRTMTNDRIWSKSSVLCDLSLDKSHGRNIFRIIVRYIAPLLL